MATETCALTICHWESTQTINLIICKYSYATMHSSYAAISVALARTRGFNPQQSHSVHTLMHTDKSTQTHTHNHCNPNSRNRAPPSQPPSSGMTRLWRCGPRMLGMLSRRRFASAAIVCGLTRYACRYTHARKKHTMRPRGCGYEPTRRDRCARRTG